MATEQGALPPQSQNKDQEPKTQQTRGTPAGPWHIRLMGWGLVAMAMLLIYLFLRLWPSGLKPDVAGDTEQMIYLFRAYISFPLTLDQRLILMVMMAGGLGSFIHAATSFGDFVGNEKLTTNWIWWYILRPAIGMVLAAIFYLVIRGGLLSAGTEAGNINPFGIAALAGLVGMFSKQATDKLSEVFDTLFRTAPGAGDSKRKDDLNNPVPVVADIEPRSKEPLTDNLLITVTGSGFIKGSVVRVKGENRETEFKDPTALAVKLLPDDVASEGELELTVFNPGPGGGASIPIKLKIAPTSAPAPASASAPATAIPPGGGQDTTPAPAGVSVTDISPDSGTAKGGTPVTISGAGFAAPASVSFGQTPAVTVAVLSDTAIIVQTPPHEAGAVDLVVEITGRGKAVSAGGFTYKPGA